MALSINIGIQTSLLRFMILYIYPVRTAFTDRDVEMLSTGFKVRCLPFTTKPLLLQFYFVFQFLQLILYLPITRHYLCFFSGYHSVLPTFFGKLFRKKTFIQCGGTDAINMPEINYGNFRKKWLKIATVYSFKNCYKILPVADSLVKSNYIYDPLLSSKQGVLNLIPELNTPIEVIYNGFDSEFWKDFGDFREEYTFVTVAIGISNQARARIKGIDLIEKLAELFPDHFFTLVGDDHFKTESKNIKLIGPQDKEGLRKIFNENRYYFQLSTSEGFPNSLAEAMLCGCVPIGSAVGDIPKIIGDTGFILETKNILKLTSILNSLDEINFEFFRKKAREKITTNFTYQTRKEKLLALFT